MRPRLLHLGSEKRYTLDQTIHRCFNEAEAFTPRIRPEKEWIRQVFRRFNEAEAFTPRIQFLLL